MSEEDIKFKTGVTRVNPPKPPPEKKGGVKIVPKGFDYDEHYERIFGKKPPKRDDK
jgi:hypothetical protein